MIYGVKCFRKIKEYTEHGTLGDIIHDIGTAFSAE